MVPTGYMDWRTGTCRFDTDSFGSLLKLIKSYTPDSVEQSTMSEMALIAQGRQLLLRQRVGTANYMQVFDNFFDNPVLIGFPTTAGIGNAISYDGSFSISATSAYGDAAWSFIRQFYTVEYFIENEENLPFPINAEALAYKYEHAGDGFMIIVGDVGDPDGYTIEIGPATEEDIARIQALIESLDRIYHVDYRVFDIVWDEAQAYFQGDKSVEDVAAMIQNRVATYMAEKA